MKKEQILLIAGAFVVVIAVFAIVSANGLFTARVAPTGWTQTSTGSQQPASPSPACGDGVCATAANENNCSCATDCAPPQFPACGTTWSMESLPPPTMWENRAYFSSVVYNDKMFIIGGRDASAAYSDVWSSTDGLTWIRIATAVPPVYYSVVFQGKIWAMAQHLPVSSSSIDIYSSTDGITWNLEVTAPFASNNFIVFNNKIWAIGGWGYSTGPTSRIMSSSDGITWTEVTPAAPWSVRSGGGVVAFNNKIWIMGGYAGAYLREVWSSPDGITWTQSPLAPWSGRMNFAVIPLNGKMWVYGGKIPGTSGVNYNDVWSSSDGNTWTQVTPAAPWSVRSSFGAVAYHNKLWMMGGESGFNPSSYFNDVWHTQ